MTSLSALTVALAPRLAGPAFAQESLAGPEEGTAVFIVAISGPAFG